MGLQKISVLQEREHNDDPSEPERIRLVRYQGIAMPAGNREHILPVLDRKEGMGFLHQTSAVTVQGKPTFLTPFLASPGHVATPGSDVR